MSSAQQGHGRGDLHWPRPARSTGRPDGTAQRRSRLGPARVGRLVLSEGRSALVQAVAAAVTTPRLFPVCRRACSTWRSAASASPQSVSTWAHAWLKARSPSRSVWKTSRPFSSGVAARRGAAAGPTRCPPVSPYPRRPTRIPGRSMSAAADTRSPRAIVGLGPRNQAMLAGSTPTSTGRPWKKISSRQPTRTNARHGDRGASGRVPPRSRRPGPSVRVCRVRGVPACPGSGPAG